MESLFVTCPASFEELLFQELKSLGIPDLNVGYLGVFARKSMDVVYKINYASRIATRVLFPLIEFRCTDKEALYGASRKIDWARWIQEGETFAIDANVSHPNIRNSLFGAQVMKDGVCDAIRETRGTRPSVDVKTPDVQLHLFIHNQRGIISIDTSGDPLFKRGWRTKTSPASIQENLAAGLLMHAGYKGGAFCDPLAGSGTFLVEAAMIATKTPAGFLRKKWGFFKHPDFKEERFQEIKAKEDEKRIPLEAGLIQGADIELEMVEMMQEHLSGFDFGKEVVVQRASVARYAPQNLDLIVSNPPFGKRLEIDERLFENIGGFLLRNKGAFKKAYFLATDPKYLKMMGVPFTRVLTFSHGGAAHPRF